ncbi:MAG: hypothetical protein SGI98_00255 [Verrucomicrobiota bacterium]|nr:hypothetical protein [Verrucomicrobiota bacterium]
MSRKRGTYKANGMGSGRSGSLPLLAHHDDLLKVITVIAAGVILVSALAYGFLELYWRTPIRFRHGLFLKGVPFRQETLIGAVHRSNQPLVWNLIIDTALLNQGDIRFS